MTLGEKLIPYSSSLLNTINFSTNSGKKKLSMEIQKEEMVNSTMGNYLI